VKISYIEFCLFHEIERADRNIFTPVRNVCFSLEIIFRKLT